MADLEVRLATPDDAAAIHALMLAAFGPFKHQYTAGCYDATVLDAARIAHRMSEGPVWVVVQAGAIAATVSARRDDRGLYVRGLAVHPAARRSGLGRLLLQVAQDHAVSVGAPCLWLSTTRFLMASQQLYRDAGFKEAPGPKDLFEVPLVSFQKDLGVQRGDQAAAGRAI